MFRRLFWMLCGALFGLWGRRKAINKVEQHVPPKLLNAVVRSVRSFADEVARTQEESKRTAARKASIDAEARIRE